MHHGPIVIVGGGHAAAQLCATLADGGHGAHVHLVCEEPRLPYQRPPLSKGYLKAPTEAVAPHRSDDWFRSAGITVHLGDAAVAVDRAARAVRLASGTALPYEHLVFATGTRARGLPELPAGLGNVLSLRSAADAEALRAHLATAKRLTVLGGGFIGLEVAATARAHGLEVEVLESAPRLLARSVSPAISAAVEASHRAAGTAVRLGVRVGTFEIAGDRLVALQVDGVRQEVELLLLGIGAVPETELARQAGLEVDNGIVVDARLRSSDLRIFAIGDCANFPDPRSDRRLRLESVQNANDQAKCVAAALTDREAAYTALPWFWSDQGALRLQMTGLMPAHGERHRRPGPADGSFSVLHYVDGRFVCIETVNAPADHIMGRKLLEAGTSPPPEQACQPGVALKSFL